MAKKRCEYRLKIDAYTRETMPMKRLAEYLADMAVLFGEEGSVHLIAIESSSTSPVVLVDWEAEPKVHDRLIKVRDKEGPEDAQRASRDIDARLARDNASAELISPSQGRILAFPGIKTPKPLEWPSINQAAELCGVPVSVGGRTEMSNVHLLDGDKEWICLTERAKAISIAHHLYAATLRVYGRGRWRKAPGGRWDLERFVIEDFDVLKISDIEKTITELRDVEAQWKNLDDPLATLNAIRSGESGEDEKSNGGIR